MGLRTKKRSLGGHGARAYYTEHPRPALMALEHDLSPSDEEALLVEGEGYFRKRPPKGGRKFCFSPRHPYDFDPNAILAIRSVVDDLRPEWVKEIKEAARMSNDPRWIAAWCEMSVQVVVAILGMLRERGEITGSPE